MKTIFFHYDLQTTGVVLRVSLKALLRAIGIEVEGESGPIPAEVLDSLRVGIVRPGVSGTVPIRQEEGEASHYEVDGDLVTVTIGKLPVGISTLLMEGSYGTNLPMKMLVELTVPQGAEEGYDEAKDIDFGVVKTIGGGGGGDYKTDVYMDSDGRVILERLDDGSTVMFDEHENPILKRNADGSTVYFDAYQSARLLIDASGNVLLNYTEDEAVKTLQLAEAILARTTKHLLTNTAGETTIKDEEGNVLTHAQIYDMLMNTPDFVVLVRSDHAFHPNLVTPTQIAFTCTYLGTDGQISTERVNITDKNEVSYSIGKGVAVVGGVANVGGIIAASNFRTNVYNVVAENYSVAFGKTAGYGNGIIKANGVGSIAHGQISSNTNIIASADGSHAEGYNSSTASGVGSHSEGRDCTASAEAAHAEGNSCKATGLRSHAEGSNAEANGGTSHAEGNYNKTGANGGSAHAEGSYTEANAAASHTEGYRTVTTEGGSHAQGCWNKAEGGTYAFMHGCGTGTDDRKNAFLIAGSEVYMYGIGGYDGTNYGQEGVQSVQAVIRALQVKTINL